jgi:hypothetical protein
MARILVEGTSPVRIDDCQAPKARTVIDDCQAPEASVARVLSVKAGRQVKEAPLKPIGTQPVIVFTA